MTESGEVIRMRSPMLPALLLGLLLLACRAEPQRQPPPVPSPTAAPEPSATLRSTPMPLDPAPASQTPSAVFRTFLDVVRAGDHAQAWNLLTAGSQAELGPSSEEFASRAFAGIKVRFGFVEGPRLALDQVINPTLAIVAVTMRRTPQAFDAVAAALVRDEGVWKLALHGHVPVEVETLSATKIVLRAPQVTLERLWLDGKPTEPVRNGDTYTVQIVEDQQTRPAVVAILARLQSGEPLGLAFPIRQ